MTIPARSDQRSDGGFTLAEISMVMSVSGVLIAALAAAISVALSVAPTSEDRIDDARSTRSLSTWLSHDTTSTPPYWPEQAVGGFDIDTGDNGVNNECGGVGTNVVHMRWTETVNSSIEYVTNYRFVTEGEIAKIRRHSCFSENGGPYTAMSNRAVTPGLDPAQVPSASITLDGSGNVDLVSFTLAGSSGETVLVETTSRNPSDFFP